MRHSTPPLVGAVLCGVLTMFGGLLERAGAQETNGPTRSPPSPSTHEVGFKTIHAFDLDSEEAERDLLQILSRFNALFDALGHEDCRYRLWELEEAGEASRYLVHALPEYEKLLAETFPVLSPMLKNHRYERYHEIPILSPGSQ